jgi:dihydrofolate reductase
VPKTTVDITTSLDGFVAGPNRTVEQPLGDGGEQLHEWVFGLASWREQHGLSGGETGPDDELLKESLAATGAVVMGRRMFSGGEGAWEDDPVADGWWGDEPPFGVPVFIVTHHPRETVQKQGGTSFTFVTEGVEAAVEQARAVAGDRNVAVSGGASIVELQVHVAPVLLGAGVRLFADGGPGRPKLGLIRVAGSAAAAHLKYRVVK